MKNKPFKLKIGDTIGIINPAFKNPADAHEKYKYMVEAFEKRGYKLKFGATYLAEHGYLAGDDELRAKDLENMFLDDEVKAIICARGGYGATRMVDKIDYQIIKKHPKIFCGFSDITVLLNAINQQADVPTIHGLISIFIGGSKLDSYSIENFWHTLEDEIEGDVLKNPNDNCKTLIKGKATGELVGGNLSLLATLTGSRYQVDFTDKIVFIEEVTEEPYQIDRYMSSLRLAKQLEKARGFVFGYFSECNPSEARANTQTYLDIIKDYVGKLGKPTIYDFACGHDFPFINLPIGLNVELDADQGTLKILEQMYRSN